MTEIRRPRTMSTARRAWFTLLVTPLLVLALFVAQSGAVTYTVTTTSDSGSGSLRQAITDANTNAGADTIVFNTPTSDPGYVAGPPSYWSITILSALPTVTDSVVIDGYTQAGAQRNTVPAPGVSNAVLKIEIRGDSTPFGTTMMRVGNPGAGCRISGLVLNRARSSCLYLAGPGGNLIDGNYIGTDITGILDCGATGGYAVNIIGSPNNTVGGYDPGARNLLSGNSLSGVGLAAMASTNNLIIGNFIGTDVTGTVAIPNSGGGIQTGAATNTIGVPGAGNLISGNSSFGLRIADNGEYAVQANLIGTDITGASALANNGPGVYLERVNWDPNNCTIGGPNAGEGNIIAYNTGDGVDIEGGTGHLILSNVIHSNGGLGIDLNSDGVTANDAGDSDSGANGLQNYTVLSSVVTNGTDLTVAGSLNSTANTTFTLQFFANVAADPSGYGEGQTFVADTTVTTDGGGDVSFQFTFFGAVVPVGQLITATATSPQNNTSEFCQALGVVVPIELSSFAAFCVNGAVRLSWTTASEKDNLGFHVYRAEGVSKVYTRLTAELIPGAGTSLNSHSYSFVDKAVETGMGYSYRLADVDIKGVEIYHNPVSVVVLPAAIALEQNCPNPFADVTTFRLALPAAGDVRLSIYNMAGEIVRELVHGRLNAGVSRITWDGRADDGILVGSGTYLCQVQAGTVSATRQIVVLK